MTDVGTPTSTDNRRSGHGLTIAVAAGAAVLAASLLSACGTNKAPVSAASPPAASPSSTVDPDQAAVAAKVTDTYNKLEQAIVAASATSDWNSAEFPKYAGAAVTLDIRRDLRTKQQMGLVTTGRPTWTVQVTAVDLTKHSANLQTCFDGTDWQVVHKDTGSPAAAPGQAKKYIINATALQYDDGLWRIETLQADRSHAC